LASLGDAVIGTDPDGAVLFVNSVAEKLIGWSQHEAQGRPLADVFRVIHQETRDPIDDPVARALAEGRIVGLADHSVLVARDGTETSIDDSATAIRDDHG